MVNDNQLRLKGDLGGKIEYGQDLVKFLDGFSESSIHMGVAVIVAFAGLEIRNVMLPWHPTCVPIV